MNLFLILQTSTFDVKIPVMTAIFLHKSQMRNHRILTRVFLHHVENSYFCLVPWNLPNYYNIALFEKI